jgi:hypothetical protein
LDVPVAHIEGSVMEQQLRDALAALIRAMDQSVTVGCTDHLDCWDDAGEIWHRPLADAKELIGERG